MQFHEVLWAAFTNATEHARFIYDFQRFSYVNDGLLVPCDSH